MELLGFQRGNMDHQALVSWRMNRCALQKEFIAKENAKNNPFDRPEDDCEKNLMKAAISA